VSTTTEQRVPRDGAALELTPVLSARFALQWRHLAVCGLFCAFFVYLNYIPLFFSDIWCHVHYGKWALEHGGFPQDDPFMPLAAGMQAVNTAWLAQLLFALAEDWGGAQFLSNVFALTVLATYLVYARAFYSLTGRLGLAVLGAAMVLFVGWTRHAIIRPEIFGGLSFALLVWMLVQGEPWRSRRPGHEGDRDAPARLPWAVWIGVPLLFALWANVHGSFMTGLVALGCHALGRVIEVAWRSRSVSAVLADGWVRRWMLLTEIAFAATLLNPVGIDLLIETLRFGQNLNLRDVLEWFPLRATAVEGVQFGITIIAMLVLLRHSRVRMTPSDVLLLLAFGLAVGPTIRMIGWWASVFTLAMLPHLAAVAQRFRPVKAPAAPAVKADGEKQENLTPAHFLPSLICLLLVWTAFALSPISQDLLSDKPREREQIVARGTPLGATAWLREHPPEGIVFGPQWWSDWLCWDGPPDLKVFVTSHIHLVPRRVWRDYMRVARGEQGWSETLDRYGVKLLVVDKELQQGFQRTARRSADWKIAYEDDRAIILQRVEKTSTTAPRGGPQNADANGVAARTPVSNFESNP
jgi:hypothetical protein